MMSKRLTAQNFHDLASKRGFVWLGPQVANNSTKTTWHCQYGHEWEAIYSNISQGKGCPYCANRVPKTPEDYSLLAHRKGFEWLGPEVATTQIKTTWKCERGHTWRVPYSTLQGCPHCAGNLRKSAEDYHLLANQRGFDWLGTEVRKVNLLTEWRCPCGHAWMARYNDIQQGKGCPNCAIRKPRNAGDYANMANKRGIYWLGPFPIRTTDKTGWQCPEGHVWSASFHSIQHSAGCGCPTCGRVIVEQARRLKPKDYHDLAARRGFLWLGPSVSNTNTPTLWQCPNGHTWETTYTSIYTGNGCHRCHNIINGQRVSKPQFAVHEILGGELNYRVDRYSLDIALDRDGKRICVEYDCWYWHNAQRDAERDKRLIALGWHVLRIKAGTLIPSLTQLNEAIGRLTAGETYTEIILDDWVT